MSIIYLLLFVFIIGGFLVFILLLLKRSKAENSSFIPSLDIKLPENKKVEIKQVSNSFNETTQNIEFFENYNPDTDFKEKSREFVNNELLKHIPQTPANKPSPNKSKNSALFLLEKIKSLRGSNFNWATMPEVLNFSSNPKTRHRIHLLIEAHKLMVNGRNVFLNVLELGCKKALRTNPNADAATALKDALDELNILE
ncbi:MAG TPA: hypothetical protein VK892_19465 [Pyrinomonadaceae bacterium]|nr:hypothetical protein [Pyrinomonadaceae bacterium]